VYCKRKSNKGGGGGGDHDNGVPFLLCVGDTQCLLGCTYLSCSFERKGVPRGSHSWFDFCVNQIRMTFQPDTSCMAVAVIGIRYCNWFVVDEPVVGILTFCPPFAERDGPVLFLRASATVPCSQPSEYRWGVLNPFFVPRTP
jgi:hypothetical protein